MARIGKAIAVVVSVVFASAALAGMPSIPGFGKSKSSATSAPDGEKIVVAYSGAVKELLSSHAQIADALGDKENAVKWRAAADSMVAGAAMTAGDVEKHTITTREADAAFNAASAESKTMDDAAKKKMEGALVSYFKGLKATQDLVAAAGTFGKEASAALSSADAMSKVSLLGKLKSGMYVATELPGFLSMLIGTGGKLMTFAKANNIKPPPDDAIQKMLSGK